jgi:hypothetical protein
MDLSSKDRPFFKDLKTGQEILIPEIKKQMLVRDFGQRLVNSKDWDGTIAGTQGRNFAGAGDSIYYFDPSGDNTDLSDIIKVNKAIQTRVNIKDDVKKVTDLKGIENLLFYIDYSDGGMYCVNSSDGRRDKVFDFYVSSYGLSSDGIYFVSSGISKGLYKAEFKNGKITKLNSESMGCFYIYKGYVYYSNYKGDGCIYRIKLDGSGKKAVINSKVDNFKVYDGYIYYLNKSDGDCLYRSKIDGTCKEKIIDKKVFNFNIDTGYIYYSGRNDDEIGLYRCRVNGINHREILKSCSPDFYVKDNMVSYIYKSELNAEKISDVIKRNQSAPMEVQVVPVPPSMRK